jgi:hypothetical protein
MSKLLLTRRSSGGVEVPPEPPPSEGIVFSSSWATATGNSSNAVTDGGNFNDAGYCGRDDILSVVSASSVGFTRSTNVFAVAMRGDNGCGQVQRLDAYPLGQSHWGRMYFRNDETQMGGSIHNWSYNFVGDIQLIFFNRQAVSGGWVLEVRLGADWPYGTWKLQTGPGTDVFNPPLVVLSHQTWYRYEWHVEFIDSATRYRFYPRLYTEAGTLLYDESNFYQESTPTQGTATLSSWYAAGNSFAFSDLELMRNIGIGNEGRVPSPNSGEFWYVGNFAISTSDWIGA